MILIDIVLLDMIESSLKVQGTRVNIQFLVGRNVVVQESVEKVMI